MERDKVEDYEVFRADRRAKIDKILKEQDKEALLRIIEEYNEMCPSSKFHK